MRLVTRDDIERWANTPDSKPSFPYLISKLVRASTPVGTKVDFPSGSAINIGGWDGIVKSESETSYVPLGTSLWELGTGSDYKKKANEDYEKRTKDPINHNSEDSIFIFVTPRIWTKKEVWIKEKKASNAWKDVIVYDSVDIEQWLELNLPVSLWFAELLKITPPSDIVTTDLFWKEWSTYKKLELLPEIIISGRESEKEQIQKILQGDPRIIGIRASTKTEAIAFIIACAKIFPSDEAELFFAKALIVNTESAFRSICNNRSDYPLVFIPTFHEAQALSAASNCHHILVPLGADDDDLNLEIIKLPIIDRDGQIKSLIKSGISNDNANWYSKESGRNITILKKILGFPDNKAKWFSNNIQEIIPALLLGRWNENFDGDIDLIEQLSDKNYDDYLIILNEWKNFEESPIWIIGDSWRLTSPFKLWLEISDKLTLRDFNKLNDTFNLALKYDPENRKRYSDWVKEGLIQSLILVGTSKVIKIKNFNNSQDWVDSIILDLLNDVSAATWVSLDNQLPLISEASPHSFLKSVNQDLNKNEPEIMEMFRESRHTGLLWALEGLAWLPDYLQDVSCILLKLSRLDPGGNLSNRPLNSITEIFLPWHYQTHASYDNRMAVLEYVINKEKEKAWCLLINMLNNKIANSTYKMRWRMFDQEITDLKYTNQEINDTYLRVIDILINSFDYDEDKLSKLIWNIIFLNSQDTTDRVLAWANEIYLKVTQKNFITWHTIRKISHLYRSYKNFYCPELPLEDLYNKLQPVSTLDKYIWLFNENCHDNDFQDSLEKSQGNINNQRKEAAQNFISELGLDKTLDLRNEISELSSFGYTLAGIVTNYEDILTVCKCLYDDENKILFIRSFIYSKFIENGFEWTKSLFNNLKKMDYDNYALCNVLIPIKQSQELWDFISTLHTQIQDLYWENMEPKFYNVSYEETNFGVEMILKYKRFSSLIYSFGYLIEKSKIKTKNLIEILKGAAGERKNQFDKYKYRIHSIFDEIYKRDDVEKTTIKELEILYLGISNDRRYIQNIDDELANNPKFFINYLKSIWNSNNRELIAYTIFHPLQKIPGMREDYSIDEPELINWIEEVLELAKDNDMLERVEIEIGKLLAQYPEHIPEWPQEVIFRIIEKISSLNINESYSSALYNKRSFSGRGCFEGGSIEKKHAAYFEQLSIDCKYKYPTVAEIFENLAKNYTWEAAKRDEEAIRDKLDS